MTLPPLQQIGTLPGTLFVVYLKEERKKKNWEDATKDSDASEPPENKMRSWIRTGLILGAASLAASFSGPFNPR